jgi:hypothetical protein
MTIQHQLPDNTGCQHKLEGQTRTVDKFLLGYCGLCRNQVALVIDKSGKPTGKSFIIEFEP